MLKASLLLALSAHCVMSCAWDLLGLVAAQPSSLGWRWCLRVESMICVGRQAQQFEQM